jgi:hypothetical protein
VELLGLFFCQIIITMFNSSRIRWTGHVADTGLLLNTYKILTEKIMERTTCKIEKQMQHTNPTNLTFSFTGQHPLYFWRDAVSHVCVYQSLHEPVLRKQSS